MEKVTLNVGGSIPWAGGPCLNKKHRVLAFPSLCVLIMDMCPAVSDSCPYAFPDMMPYTFKLVVKTKPSSLSFLLSEQE